MDSKANWCNNIITTNEVIGKNLDLLETAKEVKLS